MNQALPPASPCIGICRIEGSVCVGCHRTLMEIGGWSTMSSSEQSEVLRQLAARKNAKAIAATPPQDV